MIWLMVAYHVILMFILLRVNVEKPIISIALLISLFIPSIINVIAYFDINATIDLFNTIRVYGLFAVELNFFVLRLFPVLIIGIGILFLAAEILIPNWRVPLINLKWLRFLPFASFVPALA